MSDLNLIILPNQASSSYRNILLPGITHELVYCVKGSFNLLLSDAVYKCRRNEYIIIPPNICTTVIGNHAELFMWKFDCDNFDNVICLSKKQDNDIFTVKTLLQLMWREKELNDSRSDECAASYERILLAKIANLTYNTAQIKSSLPEPLVFVSAYIEKHYAEKIDLPELFEQTGYSYNHIRHLFKQYFDTSPKQYLIKQRLLHAREELKNSDLPPNEIAEKCGFESTAYFNMYFKNKYNQTPLEYRNEQR